MPRHDSARRACGTQATWCEGSTAAT